MVRTLTIKQCARDDEVEAAGDGRSALQIVQDRTPDVIVLDLGRPDMDGVDVLRRIRETFSGPSDRPVGAAGLGRQGGGARRRCR